MKKLTLAALSLALAGASSLALAAPAEMTTAQMDQVTAGTVGNGGCGCSLTNIALVDLIDANIGSATATNTTGFGLLVGQSAGAANYQVNYSKNFVFQH
ncbi:MAG: hypothetical protein ACOY5C_05525 [Pseudomonadota bacterium]|uniref:hypothetical protein n=1 Tax=Thermithiobacillus tepidarius TaxID=929 RepID=UPI0003FFFB33|nr:hypothetical protein [Thermithiobacillus tepidarius]